jgi:hypothetical protein
MPFDLTNAGQTFQRLMDSLFCSFPFIFIYLDNILVFSHSRAKHLGIWRMFSPLLQPTACTLTLPNAILHSLR